MKRELRKRKDERLGQWYERIAPLCVGMSAAQIYEVLREVSVTSYAEGSNSTIEIMSKIK
jgi:peptidoglycan biosynthesis protein MviN/MurJ (putative lipid II flippase)